jgi:serine/threonine-protein kinase
MILRTAAYMSPEQARGKPVDKRADIWAFGVILYELLTGKMLFGGDSISDTLAGVLRGPVDLTELPPETSAAVRRLLERCLERDPKLRLRDIGEARILLSSREALAEPGSKPGTAPRPAPWRMALVWAAVGIVVATVGMWLAERVARVPNAAVTRLSISLPAGYVVTGGPPAVSRDGHLIAYAARGPDNVSRLYVRALDRFEAVEIPGSQGAQEPFFSPDGRRIGFYVPGKLMTAAVEGGAPVRLTSASFQPLGAGWATDGNIYFTTGVTSGILAIPATGGQPRQVTTPDEAGKGYAHGWPQFIDSARGLLFTVWGGRRRRSRWLSVAPTLRDRLDAFVEGKLVDALHVLRASARRGRLRRAGRRFQSQAAAGGARGGIRA